MIWILREENAVVTDYYLNILKQASRLVYDGVTFTHEIPKSKSCKSSDIIIVGNIVKALNLYLKGYKNLIVWFQGVVPEESYLKRRSKIRKRALEVIEKFILKKTILPIFVSDAMRIHYENKYNINFTEKYYIMPCFNTELNKDSFIKKEKYSNNTFAYTGGLSVWQGFDKILECYEEIEKMGIPNTKLIVLTPETDKAVSEIKKTSISNYDVGYVDVKNLPTILSDVKFGFVIRENNIVNQVATPTKLSTYLANGLIPIYSECITDFHKVISDFKFKLSIDSDDFSGKLIEYMTKTINSDAVYNEYSSLFENYYSSQYHTIRISAKIKNILTELNQLK